MLQQFSDRLPAEAAMPEGEMSDDIEAAPETPGAAAATPEPAGEEEDAQGAMASELAAEEAVDEGAGEELGEGEGEGAEEAVVEGEGAGEEEAEQYLEMEVPDWLRDAEPAARVEKPAATTPAPAPAAAAAPAEDAADDRQSQRLDAMVEEVFGPPDDDWTDDQVNQLGGRKAAFATNLQQFVEGAIEKRLDAQHAEASRGQQEAQEGVRRFGYMMAELRRINPDIRHYQDTDVEQQELLPVATAVCARYGLDPNADAPTAARYLATMPKRQFVEMVNAVNTTVGRYAKALRAMGREPGEAAPTVTAPKPAAAPESGAPRSAAPATAKRTRVTPTGARRTKSGGFAEQPGSRPGSARPTPDQVAEERMEREMMRYPG